MSLWAIFLTGLTTGGLSCVLVQGGLLAGIIANQKNELAQASGKNMSSASAQLFKYWLPVGIFLSSKLVVHILFGFLLGAIGSFVTVNLGILLFFQIAAGLFMLAMAGNLLAWHPVFRFVVLQPPRLLWKKIKRQSTARRVWTPAILGALTVFIPCGVTQVMELAAVASGDPWRGAAIMGVFVLGTVPLFSVIGLTTASLTDRWQARFTKIAAWLLIAMAVYIINGSLLVMNSPITLQRVVEPVRWFFSDQRFSEAQLVEVVDGVQQVRIQVLDQGYSPNYIQVRAGTPVELTLESKGVYTCALAFVLADFGINTFLDSYDVQKFEFLPTQPGRYTFACSMGMYSGVLEVVE